MNFVQRIEKWGDSHHPKWIDFIRIALGAILVLKGVQYINNMTALADMMNKARFINMFSVGMISHYVIFAHLMEGDSFCVGCLPDLPV